MTTAPEGATTETNIAMESTARTTPAMSRSASVRTIPWALGWGFPPLAFAEPFFAAFLLRLEGIP